jgi:hypothetical protein
MLYLFKRKKENNERHWIFLIIVLSVNKNVLKLNYSEQSKYKSKKQHSQKTTTTIFCQHYFPIILPFPPTFYNLKNIEIQ